LGTGFGVVSCKTPLGFREVVVFVTQGALRDPGLRC